MKLNEAGSFNQHIFSRYEDTPPIFSAVFSVILTKNGEYSVGYNKLTVAFSINNAYYGNNSRYERRVAGSIHQAPELMQMDIGGCLDSRFFWMIGTG